MNDEKRMNERMLEEIKAQAQLFTLCADELIEQAKTLIRTHVPTLIDRVYITGCGDSYFAGIACREAFLRLTGLRCEVWQALEFSRYVCPREVDERALVLSVSTSGRVARTREAALRAREKGAVSLAVTGGPNTPLAETAAAAFTVNIPSSVGLAPGTRSYAASQLALLCLALALGEERGVICAKERDAILADIGRIGDAIQSTVDANAETIARYADWYLDETRSNCVRMYHLLGSGPNAATAQFGSMKLLESCSFPSIATGVEEWAHAQYFLTDLNTHVILLAPQGACRDRAGEILRAVSVADGTSIVICEEEDAELRAAADICFPICGIRDIPEWLSHLIYAVPLELLALTLSEKLGRAGLDFERRPWLREENFRQIFDSKIRSINEEEKND